jgi:hypothetical protein
MAPARISPALRLEQKAAWVGDCLIWQGAKTRDGYGVMGIGRGKQHRAHRVAYELANGPIEPGAVICHRCDTPLCVNPAHLFAGTPGDNTRDMHAKGRAVVRRGADHHASKVSHADRDCIRSLRQAGQTLEQIAARYGVAFQTVSAICRMERNYGSR